MKSKFRKFPDFPADKAVSVILLTCFVSIAAGWFLGCANFIPPQDSPLAIEELAEVKDLTDQVQGRNATLKTFKGLGRMEWLADNTVQHARLAWAGELPNKIRLEILDIAGRPALTISTDGEQLYFFSHSDQRFEKTGALGMDLQEFISIAVSLEDIVQLLAGRLPFALNPDEIRVARHSSAQLSLLVHSGWIGERRRVDLNPADATIQAFERFQPMGALLYRAEFEGYNRIDDFLIPNRIALFADNGSFCKLKVERYWANAPVSSDLFTMAPPKP